MEIGVILPQLPAQSASTGYHDFATTVEDLGYHHVLAYDHVLEIPVHEPLTLLTSLATVTERIQLVTGILILPQRQTALVAKQAAEVDILSDGRLRLGVGIGWNQSEYVALGEDFTTRGQRIEEQVEVLRQLWTEETVDFDGTFHEIPEVGLSPSPAQQPIPLWMGGTADIVLRRIARLADGWVLPGDTPDELKPRIQQLSKYLDDEGRDLADVARLARMTLEDDDPTEWVNRAAAWRDAGATHLAVDADNTDELSAFAEALSDTDLALAR